jgi:transcriptional regulator with XRE-family HTH domain
MLANNAYCQAMSKPVEIPSEIRTLGEAIRYVRQARGLTLRETARRIGVSAPFLSDVERNRRATDKLNELAAALRVSIDELARFDARLSPELKEWISRTPGVSDLLREIKDSGLSTYQIRSALVSKKG